MTNPTDPWNPADANSTYRVDGWSNGYFSIGDNGRMRVHPEGPEASSVEIQSLIDELRQRGIDPPVLLRFSDIVGARVREINEAFTRAIEEFGYGGTYRGVYPIKVNQDRTIVERLTDAGRRWHHGLEVGSKPELLAAISMLTDDEALIICNGYKDADYVETALLASKLGRRVVIVIEKPAEVAVVAKAAERTGVAPGIGLRARLASRGAGRWEASGGERSKFGLAGRELVDAMETLDGHGLVDRVELLHFHIGSQIASIRAIKDAIREAAWIYVNLRRMGAPIEFFDVGGGLGVDYDGSRTKMPSSMNYTLQEYANDVVYGVQEICDPEGVPHPTLVTESGRATVAHHAVLVVELLGDGSNSLHDEPEEPALEAETPLRQLWETYVASADNGLLEAWHDAVSYRDQCLTLFRLGHLSLIERAQAEELFRAIARRIHGRTTARLDADGNPTGPGEEGLELEQLLAETWFCNFSLFQSLPDSWAIDQLFPIVPLSGLDRRPDRNVILADITCDSDGKIDRFIGERKVQRTLPLPARLPGVPYDLGLFLVGAYQEILGDLHNLFGDTNTVAVTVNGDSGYTIDEVRTGNTVEDVLRYVGYDRKSLIARLRSASEEAVRSGRMTLEEARELVRMYESGLAGSTYLQS